MKNESRINFQLLLILLIPAFIFINCLSVVSQIQADSKKEQISPPSEEKFEKAADLVVPWRETGCTPFLNILNMDLYGKDCHKVTKDEWDSTEIAALYHDDGSIWFSFSLSHRNLQSLRQKPSKGFIPFAIGGYERAIVFLRMVGESKHWYEVEINEKTRATKFVLKSDPVWAKTKWDYWLYRSIALNVDSNQSPLRDKPNGKIIEEYSSLSFKRVAVLKTEEDWAYVTAYTNGQPEGWIRWRRGRDILVGCVFNDYKIPEIKLDAEVTNSPYAER